MSDVHNSVAIQDDEDVATLVRKLDEVHFAAFFMVVRALSDGYSFADAQEFGNQVLIDAGRPPLPLIPGA